MQQLLLEDLIVAYLVKKCPTL